MSRFKDCSNSIGRLRYTLFRRKHITNLNRENSTSDLAKCLTTFDLTNLGIGSILGAGIYVVVGQVSSNITGPSVTLSLFIAAVTSLLSGLCYAEFGSRVPRTTGSAYSYSYHTVGEFIAFIIGWNLILEYMIGTAADARALSNAIDYLLGHKLSNFTEAHIGRVPLTNALPDFLGFILTISVTIILAAGVKESARYTTFFNFLTAGVAIFIIVAGSAESKLSNWNSKKKFFPKGVHGVLSGAATCFYAYVGFDVIATTGEEARSPSKSIPKAMALTLLVCFTFYFGVATVLTMMVPFGNLKTSSPITEAFDLRGLHWAKWIVGLGGVAGMSASLMGSEFPLPRIIFAMASDGLLFKFLSQVWNRTEVPIFATLIPGVLTAFFTMLFDLGELVEMMSIGTLLAYSLVCTSVLLLRYTPQEYDCDNISNNNNNNNNNNNSHSTKLEDLADNDLSTTKYYSKDEKISISIPSPVDQIKKQFKKVILAILAIWILSFGFACTTLFGEHLLVEKNAFTITLFSIFLFGLLICIVWLSIQTQDQISLEKLHFKVPFVPLFPSCAIIFNIMLMVRLSYLTWTRFSVWLGIGFVLYFGYGIRHSKINTAHKYKRLSISHDDEMPMLENSEEN